MDKELVQRLDETIFPNGGQYLYGALAGPGHASKRQAVLALLGEKLPKSKCGLTLVRERLYKVLEVAENCEARKDDEATEKLVMSRFATKIG